LSSDIATAPFLLRNGETPMFDHRLNDAHDALAMICDAEWFE
jgi:hypothetical protein